LNDLEDVVVKVPDSEVGVQDCLVEVLLDHRRYESQLVARGEVPLLLETLLELLQLLISLVSLLPDLDLLLQVLQCYLLALEGRRLSLLLVISIARCSFLFALVALVDARRAL